MADPVDSEIKKINSSEHRRPTDRVQQEIEKQKVKDAEFWSRRKGWSDALAQVKKSTDFKGEQYIDEFAAQNVGKLQMVDYLSQGATAFVFAVHDKELDADVVIKLLKPGVSEHMAGEFRQEMENLGNLGRNQQNLKAEIATPRLLKAEYAGGKPNWIEMEAVKGVGMDEYIDQGGTLTSSETSDVLSQLLTVAEALNLSNRFWSDLQIKDIYVNNPEPGSKYSLDAKFIDFNTQLLIDQNKPSLKADGEFYGVAMQNARAAAYAVGMTNGKEKGIGEKPKRLTDLDQDKNFKLLPAGLRAALEAALSPDPSFRYSSAKEFKDAITSFLWDMKQNPRHLADFIKEETEDSLLGYTQRFLNTEGIVPETFPQSMLDKYQQIKISFGVLMDKIGSDMGEEAIKIRDELNELKVNIDYDPFYNMGRQALGRGKIELAESFFGRSKSISGNVATERMIQIIKDLKIAPSQLEEIQIVDFAHLLDTDPPKAIAMIREDHISAKDLPESLRKELGSVSKALAGIKDDQDAIDLLSSFKQIPYGEGLAKKLGVYEKGTEAARNAEMRHTSKEATAVLMERIRGLNSDNIPSLAVDVITSKRYSALRPTVTALVAGWKGVQPELHKSVVQDLHNVEKLYDRNENLFTLDGDAEISPDLRDQMEEHNRAVNAVLKREDQGLGASLVYADIGLFFEASSNLNRSTINEKTKAQLREIYTASGREGSFPELKEYIRTVAIGNKIDIELSRRLLRREHPWLP